VKFTYVTSKADFTGAREMRDWGQANNVFFGTDFTDADGWMNGFAG